MLSLRRPTVWGDNAAYAEADGLRKETKGISISPNFLYMSDIFRLADFLVRDSEFTLLEFIAFLSPLRLPSETLLLRADFRDGPIWGPATQSERLLIVVRSFKGGRSLSD